MAIIAMVLLLGQIPPQAPPFPKPPPQAPPIMDIPKPMPQPAPLVLKDYREARTTALMSGLPLVVFVDGGTLDSRQWISCLQTREQWGKLGWPAEPCIVVALEKGGDLVGYRLSEQATKKEIEETIERLRK